MNETNRKGTIVMINVNAAELNEYESEAVNGSGMAKMPRRTPLVRPRLEDMEEAVFGSVSLTENKAGIVGCYGI